MKAAKPVALLLIAAQITTFMCADVMAAQPYRKISLTKKGDLILMDNGSNDVDVLDSDTDKVIAMSADEPLPSSYNSDPNKLKYITPVKDQEDLGTCWSFSVMSDMETLLMKKDGVEKADENNKEKYDLSEMHMVYALSNKFKKDGQGMETPIEAGGNTAYASTYLTRERNEEQNIYNGPVYEKDFPYKGKEGDLYTNDEEIYEKIKAEPIDVIPRSYFVMRLYQAYLDNDRINKRNEIIKKALLENGSVSIGLNFDRGTYIDNKGKMLYYNNDPALDPNHAVTVVGYDDNFPAEEFDVFDYAAGDDKYPSKPVQDGAFIVKNSWDEDWGNNGFFYMSYDSHIGEISSFGNLMEKNDGYTRLYDHTPMGTPTIIGFGKYYENGEFKSRLGAGTVFKREHPDTEESLTKIGIWTVRDNTYIRLYVDSDAGNANFDTKEISDTFYDNFVEAPLKPINENTAKEGDYILIEKSGYNIFELENPVNLTGDSFTVCCDYAMKTGEKISASSEYADTSPISYEDSYEGIITLDENDGISFTYDFAENKFDDSSDYDLLLKGYTEEKVKVTVNDEEEKILPYNGVLNDDRTLYKKDGVNTYTQFDKQTPLTGNISLYTADKIGIADITLTQQDGVKEDDSTYVGTRIVGEIAKDAGGAEEVTSLGFTAYKDNKEVAIDGNNFDELYEELEGYTKKNKDSYIFTTPVMDKNNVDSVTFFGKFMQKNNTEVVVNYINRKLQNNG